MQQNEVEISDGEIGLMKSVYKPLTYKKHLLQVSWIPIKLAESGNQIKFKRVW